MQHITENLYISDQQAAADRAILEHRDIIYVVTLNTKRHRFTTTHHPLKDGENPQSQFNHAVEVVRDRFNKECNVLVHCSAGVSRSVTVVATAIAAEKDLSFQEGLAMIEEERPVANPDPALRDHAEEYLGNRQRT